MMIMMMTEMGKMQSLLMYNHTGNCNIDWIDNGRNESVPIADTESNSD